MIFVTISFHCPQLIRCPPPALPILPAGVLPPLDVAQGSRKIELLSRLFFWENLYISVKNCADVGQRCSDSSVGKKTYFGETLLFRVTDDMMHSSSVKFHLLANKVQQKLNILMGSEATSQKGRRQSVDANQELRLERKSRVNSKQTEINQAARRLTWISTHHSRWGFATQAGHVSFAS